MNACSALADAALAGRPLARRGPVRRRPASTSAGGSGTATRSSSAAQGRGINAHYRAAPVPLSTCCTAAAPTRHDEWTRVTVTGRYAGGTSCSCATGPSTSEPRLRGARALRPAADGPDGPRRPRLGAERRGRRDGARRSPPAPAGDGDGHGLAAHRRGRPGRELPAGQLASISLGDGEPRRWRRARCSTPTSCSASEQPAAARRRPRPQCPRRPRPDLGPHQAYAFQWWLLMRRWSSSSSIVASSAVTARSDGRGGPRARAAPVEAGKEGPHLGRGGRLTPCAGPRHASGPRTGNGACRQPGPASGGRAQRTQRRRRRPRLGRRPRSERRCSRALVATAA